MPSLSDGTVLDNLTAPYDFKSHQNKTFNKHWHLQKLAALDKHNNFINQSMHELSGGERQIVSFLRTLQSNPTLSLFDETTSSLDEETVNLLIKLVLDWHNEHKALNLGSLCQANSRRWVWIYGVWIMVCWRYKLGQSHLP